MTISETSVVTSHPCYDTVTLNPNNQTENYTALYMSCCMLAWCNYAARVEHCFWVPPVKIKKKLQPAALFCARLGRVDCVMRCVCEELTVWQSMKHYITDSVVTTTELWLPLNQHHHRGVLHCSGRSFWVLFPENCPSVFCRAACSNSHLNATSHDPVWNANARRLGDTARPPPCIRFPTRVIRSARQSSYTGNYDSEITPTPAMSDTHITRGNDLRSYKSRFKYDMRKF